MKLKKSRIKNLSGSNQLISDNEKYDVNGGSIGAVVLTGPVLISAIYCNVK